MFGKGLKPLICITLVLPACQGMSPESRTAAGLAGGAAAGLIPADALRADDDWRIISALAGAAAGVLVAENMVTGECAYARGDGTYYVAPCPRYRHRAG